MSPADDSRFARIATLLRLAWPIVLVRAAQAVIGFADALMVAPLGDDALAAVTAGAVNAFAITLLPLGTVFIVQSFTSQLAGRNDLQGARRYLWYGLGVAAIAALLSFAALPWIRPLLAKLAYTTPVTEAMAIYLSIRLLSTGAMVGMEALGNFYSGLGNTRIHMWAALCAMVANVFLNWVLINGHLGAPALGVAGAAWASVCATTLGLLVLCLVYRVRWGLSIPTGPLHLSLGEFTRMLRFGLPNGINWFVEFAAFLIFINVAVAHLGTSTVAALLVVFNVNAVSFMPAFGLASAGAILVGQAIGNGRASAVPAICRTTAAVCAVWQGAVGLLYLIFPLLILGWFAPPTQSADFLRIGAAILMLSACWQLFDSQALAYGEALRAAGDTTWCMWARLGLAWLVFIPGATLHIFWLGGKHLAATLWLIVYLGLLAAVLVARFRSGRWRDITLTDPVPRP